MMVYTQVLSLVVVFATQGERFSKTKSFKSFIMVDWNGVLDNHRLGHRDWMWDMYRNGIWLLYGYRMGYCIWYLHGHLYRIRDNLFHRVGYFLLDGHGVRFRYWDWVVSHYRDWHFDMHGVRDLSLHGYRIGVRDGNSHLLVDNDALDARRWVQRVTSVSQQSQARLATEFISSMAISFSISVLFLGNIAYFFNATLPGLSICLLIFHLFLLYLLRLVLACQCRSDEKSQNTHLQNNKSVFLSLFQKE